jgi:hypothetical protein
MMLLCCWLRVAEDRCGRIGTAWWESCRDCSRLGGCLQSDVQLESKSRQWQQLSFIPTGVPISNPKARTGLSLV